MTSARIVRVLFTLFIYEDYETIKCLLIEVVQFSSMNILNVQYFKSIGFYRKTYDSY